MKYGNRKTVVDGFTFDSAKEAKRYGELKLLMAAGEIAELELQPVFVLGIGGQTLKYDGGRQAKYIADFAYYDMRKCKWVIEDVKSPATRTAVYKLKKAIMRAMGKEIVEV